MSRDERTGTYRLGIRSCATIDLVAAQNLQIRLLLVQDLGDKVQSPGVGYALVAVVSVGDGLAALAHPVAQVQVCYLHDLELAVVLDPRLGLRRLLLAAPAHGEMSRRYVRRRVQQERRASAHGVPARAGEDGVVAEEDDVCCLG